LWLLRSVLKVSKVPIGIAMLEILLDMLMKSVGSLKVRVMVWLVSDTHKVMTTPIFIVFIMVSLEVTSWLPSKQYCGVFSAIS
jgi:hypothetical protein